MKKITNIEDVRQYLVELAESTAGKSRDVHAAASHSTNCMGKILVSIAIEAKLAVAAKRDCDCPWLTYDKTPKTAAAETKTPDVKVGRKGRKVTITL